MGHQKYRPPMGHIRYEQERDLVAGTDDLAWADRYEAQILKDVEREVGETIGHALNLRLQMVLDKNLRQHKLSQAKE